MKNLTIFSIIYLVLIGFIILVFARDLLVSNYELNFEFLSFSYSASINYALFLVLPLVLYVIIALLGVYISSFKASIAKRRLTKDVKNFSLYCADLVLDKEPSTSFKSDEFKQISPDLAQLASLHPAISGNILSDALAVRASIENHEYINTKLAKTSKYYELNQANLCASSLDEAKFYLKNKEQISNEIDLSAYSNIMNNASFKDIKALKIQRAAHDNELILKRFVAGNLELSAAEIEVLLFNSGFNEAQFLEAAKSLVGLLEASAYEAIFSKLAASNEAAIRARFYVLASLGMFDELRQALHSNEAKHEDFELVIFLKDHNKSYELNRLIY